MILDTKRFIKRENIPAFSFLIEFFCCSCKTKTTCKVESPLFPLSQDKMRKITCMACRASTAAQSLKSGSSTSFPGIYSDRIAIFYSNKFIIDRHNESKKCIEKMGGFDDLKTAYQFLQNYFIL